MQQSTSSFLLSTDVSLLVPGGAEIGLTPDMQGRLILGCGNFGGIGSAPAFFGQGESEEEAFAIMDAAGSSGIRDFDTADA